LWPVLRATVTDGGPQFLVGTGMTTNPIYVQDLAFWLPAMAVGVAWLWRRVPWGYLVVSAGLTFWVVESVGVAVDQWFGHAADPASSVASDAACLPFAVLAVVSLVPLVALLRGLPALPSTRAATGRRTPVGLDWALLVVQAFAGVMAVFGGLRLMADGFGIPDDWLVGSGFSSWTLPGVALIAGVAVPQLVAAALTATGNRWAVPFAWLSGILLIVWIVVQVAILQRFFFLQPVVVVLGVAELLLVLASQRSQARTG
jgi:hypothetical protein